MRKRYNNKRDANEKEIVEALEKAGASVIRIDEIDLLVGFRKRNYLLEVKTEHGQLTRSQIKLRDEWPGQYSIVNSPVQALQAIGAMI